MCAHRATMAMFPAQLSAPVLALTRTEPQDLALTVGIAVAASVWLFLWQRITAAGFVTSMVTRKIVHISCGPAFVALWPFYSDSPSARIVAAAIPCLFIARLALSARSAVNGSLAKSISRSGDANEALQGPIVYSIVLLATTLFLFQTPAGVIAITQLCFGDGFAELIGRRFGAKSPWRLPWATGGKSIAGSLGFVAAAFSGSLAGVAWMHACGMTSIHADDPGIIATLFAISVTCAAAELAPVALVWDDNVSVVLVALLLSLVLIRT